MVWNKGKKMSKEFVDKWIETRKKNGWWKNPEEHKKNISMALEGRKLSEEHKRKMIISKKGKHSSQKTEFKKGHIPWNKGVKWSKEHKEKLKNNHWMKKEEFTHPFQGKHHTKKSKDLISKKNEGIKQSKETIEKRKKTLKELWTKESYIKKIIKSRNIKPNKTEIILANLINKITPDFRYNGDFSQGIVIGRKIPDFINCNGKKQIIELFGDYWHKKRVRCYEDTEEGKIKHYKKFGFNCLVIWESELKNQNNVMNKIKNFCDNNG